MRKYAKDTVVSEIDIIKPQKPQIVGPFLKAIQKFSFGAMIIKERGEVGKTFFPKSSQSYKIDYISLYMILLQHIYLACQLYFHL